MSEQSATSFLEVALDRYLLRLTRGRIGRQGLKALKARLGFEGRDPLTLDAAGRLMDVSRERMRQLEAKARKLVAQRERIRMPELRRALRILEASAPIGVDEVPKLLQQQGITNSEFGLKSLLSAADFLRIGHNLAIVTVGGGGMVTSTAAEITPRELQIASGRARALARGGIANIQVLADVLEDKGISIGPDQLRRIISLDHRIRLREDGWFWYIGPLTRRRNRAVNVSRKMLCVSPSLSLSSLREGMRRLAAWRRRGVVPPVAVLEDFYTSRPEFVLNVDKTVSSSASLDPKEYLSDSEQEMVEVLRSAPDGIMDRSGFIDSCRKRGLNLSTVGVSTTYSPVLERMAPNVWATRGTRISPALVEVFQDEHAERHPATTASGWSSDGTYWFTVFLNITHIGSGVISLPPATPFLYGRAFKAVTAEGRPCGTINSDQRTSWGWNSFYIRSGAEPGDYLRATFDVRSGTVQLELGGPELLEPDHESSRRLGAQKDEDDEEDEEQPVG